VNSLENVLMPVQAPGLQVLGQTPALRSFSPAGDTGATEYVEADWSSSEDETGAGESESDKAAFDYRKYRYRSREPRPRSSRDAKSQKQPRQHLVRVVTREHDMVSCWSVGAPKSPSNNEVERKTSFGEEARAMEDPELRRLAAILGEFYGLPAALGGAWRLKNPTINAITIDDASWERRERKGNLGMPPTFWVRGGRVYDYQGDRGTVAEFEEDLLVRQVEDDSACRQRRQKQGLLPFPFLALPAKPPKEPS
jgi:hypothetical protein